MPTTWLERSLAQTVRPPSSSIKLLDDGNGNQTVVVRDGLDIPAPCSRFGETSFYVPYAKVLPRVLATAPADSVWVDVSTGPDAYWGALHGWWDRGETFAIIEHDVVCRPDIVRAFEGCPEPWCLYSYSPECACGNPDCRESGRNNLGCVRFRREMIEAVPDAVASIPADQRHWQRLCDQLGQNLRDLGYSHHWHAPGAEHVKEAA